VGGNGKQLDRTPGRSHLLSAGGKHHGIAWGLKRQQCVTARI
jgi:hypothetical protein